MDQAYKAYKKNKRKQKKLQAAAASAGTQPDQVPAAEIDAREAPAQETEQSLESAVQTEGPLSPVSPTNSARNKVQSLFPDLQRVKRRAPSVHERATEGGPSNVVVHTSEVSQHLPAAVAKSPKPVLESPGPAGAVDTLAETARGSLDRAHGIEVPGPRQTSPLPASAPAAWSFDNIQNGQRKQSFGDDAPKIQPSASRESLSSRRSVDPLHIETGIPSDWGLDLPKQTSNVGSHLDPQEHARTPSYDTPLEPTSRNRASYLFQSPPIQTSEVTDDPSQSSEIPRSMPGGFFDSRPVDTTRGEVRSPLSPASRQASV